MDRPRKAREAPDSETYLEMQTVSKKNSEVGGLTPSRRQVLVQTQQMGRVAETLDQKLSPATDSQSDHQTPG